MAAVATPARSGRARRPAEAAAAEPRGLSVLLVSGFLGAGKTTLVNHLLRSRGELRVAVFVNEFGAVDVDGPLLRWEGAIANDRVFSLRNGCMCCGGKDDLENVIAEELTAIRGELDLLIVETSGVTNPAPVLATLAGVSGVRVERVVCVVDATTARSPSFGSSTDAKRQLACADVVVLSKVDLLDGGLTGAGAEELLRELCPGAGGATSGKKPAVLRAEKGVVDWSTVCPTISPGGPRKNSQKRQRKNSEVAGLAGAKDAKVASGGAGSAHTDLATYSYIRQKSFNRERFEAWAQSLPGAVVRGKGLLRIAGTRRPMAWHFAGGRSGELREVECDEDPWGSELVLLGDYGPGWSPQDFDRGLDKCLARGREA